MLSNTQILRTFSAINVIIFHIIGASLHYNIPATALLFMKDLGKKVWIRIGFKDPNL